MRRRESPRWSPDKADLPFLHRMWVKLALGSIGLLVLSVSFTAGFIVRFATEQLRLNVRQRNEQIARRAAEEISSYIEGARRDLSENGAILEFLDRMPWVSGVLLEKKVMESAIFDTVVVVDRTGAIKADNRLGMVDMAEFPATALRKAMQGTTWTSPVDIDYHGLPSMTFVIAPRRGISLVARLSLERIWRLIDDIDAGPGGFAYVVSSDGTLIAHPDKAAVLRREAPARPDAPSMRNTLLVSSAVPGLGWTVYIQQPLAKAFFPVSLVLRRSLFLVLIGLAMATLVAVIVARLYSRPLDALLWGTVRIAGGDLQYQIPSHSADEIGVLSRSFNDMVQHLRERTMALEDSERRYRHVTENVRDIIFSLDASRKIVFINSRAERVLGYPLDQILGKRLLDFMAPDARENLLRSDGGPLAASHALPRELTLLTRLGEEVILELESVRSGGSHGEAEIHGIARDITQRKRMEEKLRRSEKLAALGEIVSKVAHELRNAVAGITASMEMARVRGRTHAALQQDLDRVLAEAMRAQGIVQGLLGTSAERPQKRQACSMNSAAASVIELRRGRLQAAGIEVLLELTEGLPSVMADPDQLWEVFHNLVDNAEHALGEFTRPGPGNPRGTAMPNPRGTAMHERKLRVRTWRDIGRVWAEVSDTGQGIAPQQLGKVFDPFFTTRRESGGTGLGLAVSLAIVEALGGDISVRSVPGEGTAFTVELPAGDGEQESGPVEEIDLAGALILVAEDEPAIREFVHHYLESLGCMVDSAANGQEAVALLAYGTAYSLVISDFRMPDRDGKELYEWIRVSRPGLLRRLIYITGDSLNPVTRSFLEETRLPYLLKPVVASVLASEVRRALARAAG
ncbi:MAG: ATP-binding protein [Spirochaetia bacterium]